MTDNVLAVRHETALVQAMKPTTKVERFKAYSHALEAVDDPRCKRPIPRFLLDLPWATDDDDIAERIIAQMLASDDPYNNQDAGATVSGKDLVGEVITVWDMRVLPSDKPGGWGAYLLLDATKGDNEDEHLVVTIGAKQAVALLALAWCQGNLPLTGAVMVVTETGSGNSVLGFVVEQVF
jgi:hypothetical protein